LIGEMARVALSVIVEANVLEMANIGENTIVGAD
jgi:hypothetical protein